MATIKDVARMAGVSLSTVSKYINGGNVRPENARVIAEAIAALDFHANPFARSLKMQHSKAVGILLPDISAPFFGVLVTALDSVLREKGYHTVISCYDGNHALERENLRYLISTGIQGLIYIPENLTAEEYYELTGKHNVPMVQMDRFIQGVDCDAVMVDNADVVYAATTEMINRGHRRIAMMSGPKAVATAKERQVGYLRALSDNNILYDDDLFISGGHDFGTGYKGFEKLMALPNPPDAVIAANYDITIGLFTAVRDRGLRIPEDVDIFGFDCVQVCTMMKPPLPVVWQPEEQIGKTAARYLLERMGGFQGESRMTRLKCKLIF